MRSRQVPTCALSRSCTPGAMVAAREPVVFRPVTSMPSEIVLLAWTRPKSIATKPSWAYLIASPLGVIPCPTLAATTGLLFLFNLLNSRRWAVVVGVATLVYGAIGVFRLGVMLDLVLLPASIVLLMLAPAAGRDVSDCGTPLVRKVAA